MLRFGASASRAVACDGCSDEGMGPIHFARYAEIAALLVASGADVNATSRWGRTALSGTYNVELLRVLLASGANVNAPANGRTPLMEMLQMYEANRSDRQRASEFREMSELDQQLDSILITARSEVYVLDLHSTSAGKSCSSSLLGRMPNTMPSML